MFKAEWRQSLPFIFSTQSRLPSLCLGGGIDTHMNQRLDKILMLLGILAAVLAGCADRNSPAANDGFAIYLVKGGVIDPGADPAQLALEPEPFISLDDIVAYTWETHEFELTEAARERVARLEVPVTTGVPFVVCVGPERIYAGAFWISYSSMSYSGIVIDTLPAQASSHSLRIQLGYPESPELFTGTDLRSDARLRQSLQDEGKLR